MVHQLVDRDVGRGSEHVLDLVHADEAPVDAHHRVCRGVETAADELSAHRAGGVRGVDDRDIGGRVLDRDLEPGGQGVQLCGRIRSAQVRSLARRRGVGGRGRPTSVSSGSGWLALAVVRDPIQTTADGAQRRGAIGVVIAGIALVAWAWTGSGDAGMWLGEATLLGLIEGLTELRPVEDAYRGDGARLDDHRVCPRRLAAPLGVRDAEQLLCGR